MRILVCGGRDYSDWPAIKKALDAVHEKKGIDCIINGGATGADLLSSLWAATNRITREIYEANWKQFGKSAGPIRNAVMLADGKPEGVVAFPGGSGTADMVKKSIDAGIKVWRPYG